MKIYDGRSAFYQWDVGQKLTSPTLSAGDEVHFYNVTLSHALVVKAYALDDGTVVADVPNILLQKPLVVKAYRYVKNADSSSTFLKTKVEVIKRAKPSDYVYTETELFTVEKAVESAIKKAIENGELNGGGGNGEPGKDGLTPYIGGNGHWWLGNTDTGVKASGEDGFSPIIEASYMWDTEFGVHMIDITDANGKRRLCDILDGKDGKDGADGKDYILTEADKTEIASLAKAELEPIVGDINTALEAIVARQTSVIGGIG